MSTNKNALGLTSSIHRELIGMSENEDLPAQVRFRASIILLCARGMTNQEVADELGTTRGTVWTWRSRFLSRGLEGLKGKRRKGRPASKEANPTVVLHEGDRQVLERLAGRRKVSQGQCLRARIILGCAEGKTNQVIAEGENVAPATVKKWRLRYIKNGIEGLADEPKPGAPRRISDEDIERVIVKTLETTPKGATHWSRRSMAKEVGLGRETIGRIWRAFGLQPHRSETFKLSTDPNFIDKVRDVVGLYLDPPENAVVLCVDEKSQIQALDRSQPLLPMRPGQPERRTHDYTRHGTTTLFAALNTVTGQIIGSCQKRHRTGEFLNFLKLIDKNVPKDQEVHVILDNYGTHKTALIHGWLLKRPRFHLHFTPTSSSWLNLVERWFAELTEKQIKRGVHLSVKELEEAIYAFTEAWNENKKPFIWTKTADQILESVKSFCERNSGPGH